MNKSNQGKDYQYASTQTEVYYDRDFFIHLVPITHTYKNQSISIQLVVSNE